MAKKSLTPQWTDGRKSPPLADDDTLKQAIAGVVHDRVTYLILKHQENQRNSSLGLNHRSGLIVR